jgi:hypothetical protein
MGLLDWLFGSGSGSASLSKVPTIHLAPGRGFTFGVVGESNYQDALNAICGGKREEGHKWPVTAHLRLDDRNPHDPLAVAVWISGKVVGYVAGEDAKRLRTELLALNVGDRSIACSGKIVGGWDRGQGDEGHYGLKLSLSKPLRVAPSDI